jgi:hypothetical protein
VAPVALEEDRAAQEALAEEVALELEPEGLAVDPALAAEREQVPGQKNPGNG